MTALEPSDYNAVFETVRQWPPDKRFALVHDVLDTLASAATPARPKAKTLEKVLGLLETDQPPPSDQEIEEWLGEHRIERYEPW